MIKYKVIWFLVKHGIVSKNYWRKYTNKILWKIMEDNKDVLIRLKYII